MRRRDFITTVAGSAAYVDRILRGETKYELMINLKTAKTLGLNMPALLASADEVIEYWMVCCGCSRPLMAQSRHP